MTELTGPIVRKDSAKRIAYAAVLVPGEPDTDYPAGEKILTRDEVERVAHEWLASYRNVDIQHTLNNVAVPVESYILPMEMTVSHYDRVFTLPAGTWILASKILNDEVWEGIVTGKLTGYSVMGISRDELNRSDGSVPKSASMKRTLLRDLGEGWIAAFVSIVDEPAVPKAKFFALKARNVEKEVKMEQNRVIETLQTISKSISELLTQPAPAVKEEGVSGAQEVTPAADQTPVPAAKEETGTPDIRAVVKEVMQEVLPGMVEELAKKEMSSISEDIRAIKESLTALDANKAEIEAIKADVSAFKEEVVARITKSIENVVGKRNASKALAGQDVLDSKKNSAPGQVLAEARDAYGRVRRNI